MNNSHPPNPVQYMQCAALIARVMISEDGKFTKSEIELAVTFARILLPSIMKMAYSQKAIPCKPLPDFL